MLIDIILDRKEGYKYSAKAMYDYCMCSPLAKVYEDITRALDGGTESDVKKSLVDYVEREWHGNKNIIDYINSVNWLEE